METRFQVHPARYPVIGYKELVQKVTRDDLVRYYQRMYTPNNMVVVVVGDVQTPEVLAHMRETFGQGERRPHYQPSVCPRSLRSLGSVRS